MAIGIATNVFSYTDLRKISYKKFKDIFSKSIKIVEGLHGKV